MSEVLITSFKNWPIHHHWEKAMAGMLRGRGHNVRFFTCQYPFFRACEAYDVNTDRNVERRGLYCRECYASFRSELESSEPVLQLSQYVSREQMRRIELSIKGATRQELLAYPICDTNLLEVIRPSLHRYFRVGHHDPEATPVEVLQNYAYTALMIEQAMREIISRDRLELIIVLNNQFFGENVVWRMARRAGIRVVNYERSPFHNALVFSDSGPAHVMNVDEAWSGQADRDLTPAESVLVDSWLDSRRRNLDTYFNYRSENPVEQLKGSAAKQAVLFTNVTWDSSIISQPGIFESPREWLAATINWFRQHPDYRLLIRIHPGETKLLYDPTLDSLYDHLLLTHELSDNVVLIPPEAEVDSYQLMEESDVGIALCSTAGLEMAALGKPVVLTGRAHYGGKGFTIDCPDQSAYEATLETALTSDQDCDTTKYQARKYLLTAFLRYAMPFPWVNEYEYGRGDTRFIPNQPALLAADPLAASLVEYLEGTRTHPYTIADVELTSQRWLMETGYHFSLRTSRTETEPEISVIIPTRQRLTSLRRTFEGYRRQSLARKHWELVIVADGPDPAVAALVEEYASELPVRYIAIAQAGPATARNQGISAARAQLLLITGDDITPHSDLLLQHYRMHLEHPDKSTAVLGHIDWPEELEVNAVMRLVNENGQQFGFANLVDGQVVGPEFFYTSNISLKRELLQELPQVFLSDFPAAALEDIELGMRLERDHDLCIHYCAAAKGFHHHPMTLESFAARQQNVGRSARILERIAPEVFQRLHLNQLVANVPDRMELSRLREAADQLSDMDVSHLNWIQIMDKPLGNIQEETRRRLMQKYFDLKLAEGYYQHGYLGSASGEPGKVSIIIPAYNNLQLTRQAVQAVLDNTVYPDYEIILIDNASADGTREAFQSHPDLLYIRNEQNVGFARANNQAAEYAAGEFLVLLNNDTIVQPGWLTHLVASLEADVGIVGARMIYPNETVQHAGVVFGEGEHPPYHIYSGLPMRHPAVNQRREFNAVTAACLLVRRSLYAQVKGFNENYINCYEDVDLCLKVRHAGWRIIYEPNALVIHLEGKSAGRQDKIAHSYLLLLERWRGQLQRDDLEYYRQDHIQVVPRGNTKMLREDILKTGPAWLAEADRMLAEGRLRDAEWILEYAQRYRWLQPQVDLRRLELTTHVEAEDIQA